MLAKMFVFEWRYFVRQPSFYVTSLIFFLLSFFATVSDNVQIGGGGNVVVNGPFAIAQTLNILGIFAMFLVVNFVASSAIRNDTSKMAEILYSKPINPLSYQLGRFLGSYAVVATVFAFVPLGILLGSLLGGIAGWIDPERLVDTQLGYYFSAYFILSLPTLFVFSSLFYAAAIRFRSLMAVYLVAVGIFMFYSVAGQLFSEPEYRTLLALIDPTGVNSYGEVTRYWTIFDKNNTAIEFSGLLLQNRLIWGGAALLILVFFSGLNKKIVLTPEKDKNKLKTAEADNVNSVLSKQVNFKSSGITTKAHLMLRIVFEIKQVLFSAPFIVLAALTIFLLITPLVDPRAFYGAPNWPLTQTMVQLIANSTGLLMLIIITYYSAEVVWRERNSGMGDIVDSMPVNNITFWLSKLIAISLVMTLLYIFGVAVTVANQLLQGYDNIDIGQYALRLGYVNLFPLIMNVMLAFLLQVLSPNKFVGMLLFVLFIISTLVLSSFGFSHNMWQFSSAPTVFYSDLNQYGYFLHSHNWYMLYWSGLSIVLAVLTYGLWHRGPVQPVKARFNKLNYYLGNTGRAVLVAGVLMFVGAGSYIHYNTRVLNEYVVIDDFRDSQAAYEKKYVQYLNDALPSIVKTHAKVDIYPNERRIDAVAEITVTNNSAQAISKFLVGKPRYTDKWDVIIAGGKITDFDDDLQTAWFEFSEPMQPGEQRTGQLVAERVHRGFTDGNNDFELVANGTFINNASLFPSFGYQPFAQLQDKHERKKRDLAPAQRANKLEDSQYYNQSFFGNGVGFIEFEATISTVEDQFAIAPGYLQSEKVEQGRRIFHYKMDAPMVNFYAITSAKLEVKKELYQDIAIEIYYHQDHYMNVDRMIESVKDSIDYFSANFGPYQHKQMRIIEFPGYRSFAQSFANTVPYSENIGFITDLRNKDKIDPVYYVTAHEVAHQWWGHQVGAANVQGSAVISESLSQYSALMVMEKKYGAEKIRQFLKYELDRYLRGRSVESIEEMPLLRSENQQYIHYQKGSVAMMAIKDRLGEQRLNKALADFLVAFKYQSSPYPTTLDLMAYLSADADASEKTFISNLFEHISLYDLKTTDVQVVARDDGQFDLTITINAALKRADGKGLETEQSFVDMIDIGLFSQDPEDLSAEDFVQYLAKHEIKSGENIIRLTVATKPKYVGVDPFIKLIDRDSADNIYRL